MATSDKNEIYLSSSPHYNFGLNTQKIMLAVIIALLPLCAAGVVFFGVFSLINIVISVFCCVFFEWFFRKLTKQTNRTGDLSAVVTGLLLSLVLPPELPIWMVVLGAFFAIVVAKEFFGGLGMNVFNPALVGRAFLFVSFPSAMSIWKMPFDTVTGATMLAGESAQSLPLANLLIGTRAGSLGETSGLLILAAFVFLLLVRVIDWRSSVAMIVTTVAFETVFGANPAVSLFSGGLLFGAVFMTTDYATAPVTAKGRLLFGFGCGLITALIRVFGGFPEGVMFSILIMNGLVAFLNRLTGKKYGQIKKVKAGAAK